MHILYKTNIKIATFLKTLRTLVIPYPYRMCMGENFFTIVKLNAHFEFRDKLSTWKLVKNVLLRFPQSQQKNIYKVSF